MAPDPSWDGILTSVVGMFAIVGATIVGFRQIGISKAVASAQTAQHLADIKLRKQTLQLELLEQRKDCISRFRTIWSSWHAQGELTKEEIEELKGVLWDSELVFPSDIADDIGSVVSSSHLRNYFEYRHHSQVERGRSDDDLLERMFSQEDETNSRMPSLLKRMVQAAKVVELDN